MLIASWILMINNMKIMSSMQGILTTKILSRNLLIRMVLKSFKKI